MNDLSVMRGSYIQNLIKLFMVQIPSVNKEDSSFEYSLSWKDLQGLSWIFYDELGSKSIKKNTYVCA